MLSANIKGMKELGKALEKATRYIEVHCINCGKKYKVDLKKRKVKCPKCRTEVKVNK